MVKLVSVVRDFEMYRQCIAGNPCTRGCELVTIDNTAVNLPVTVQYNRFLDALEEECWVCFCHEDWKPEVNLSSVIETLDPSCLHGPVGVFVEERSNRDIIVPRGHVFQTRKDGKRPVEITGKDIVGRVDTFDCQCLIIHSSVVDKYALRFDEKLSFDMYVEDFCVAAYERYGIESRTADIPCTHCSAGKLSGRFFDSLEYIRNKYSVSKKRYATIVGHLNTFGGNPSRPVFKWKRIPHVKLFYRLAR